MKRTVLNKYQVNFDKRGYIYIFVLLEEMEQY